MDESQSPVHTHTAPDDQVVDEQTGSLRPPTPEEGGAESGPPIDESEIDETGGERPTTENDVT